MDRIGLRAANGSLGSLRLAPLDVPLLVELRRVPNPAALAPAFEGWDGQFQPARSPLRLRIEQDDGLAGAEGAEIGVRGESIDIEGPGVSARADPAAGFAFCKVSSDYLKAPVRLREDVLEPLVLMMLAWNDRAPVHASGFLVDGFAVLLAGRSGAGKSCLAKAADDAGFQLLSDDTVYVQLNPRLRIWGWPKAVHLLPGDCSGLAGRARFRNGKLKQAITLRSASTRALKAERAVICVLSRGEELSLSPLGPEAIQSQLSPLDPGFDLLPRQVNRAIGALSAHGGWVLHLTDDPAAAVRLLAANLVRLREAAAP